MFFAFGQQGRHFRFQAVVDGIHALTIAAV